MEALQLTSVLNAGLPILFLVLLVTFGYFTATMIHHWGYYSFNTRFKTLAQSIYIGGSLLILVAIAACMGIYIFGYGI